MVAALVMLVILCQRKQRKNKQTQVTEKPDVTVTAEELFKENDRTSNISDLKLELRQANGSCEIVSIAFILLLPFLNAFLLVHSYIFRTHLIVTKIIHKCCNAMYRSKNNGNSFLNISLFFKTNSITHLS